jgi:hypothetical protein
MVFGIIDCIAVRLTIMPVACFISQLIAAPPILVTGEGAYDSGKKQDVCAEHDELVDLVSSLAQPFAI